MIKAGRVVTLLLFTIVLFFSGGCSNEPFMPGRAKVYIDEPGYPETVDKVSHEVSVNNSLAGFQIVAHRDYVSSVNGRTLFDGPVFIQCGSSVVPVRAARLFLKPDGTLSGSAMLPLFNSGIWKDMDWKQIPAALIPVVAVSGAQLLDPESEYCVQGGDTNRLPFLEDRHYLLYKVDLSVGGISAAIPGNPLKLFADKLPVPGMQIYYITDPADPSYFLTFSAKNFKALEQRFKNKAIKNKSKQKMKGIGKLDLLNGFGIGLSSQGLLQFRMDYTNLLDPSLNYQDQFGTHLWIKAKIPLTIYGLPFLLDANGGLNLNPENVSSVSLGDKELKFRLGVNGKLYFNLAAYILSLQKTPQQKEQNKKTIYALTALNSLVTIGELGGASAVLEVGSKPTLYFSTYAGNPSVTVNLGFLSKVPGLEEAGPDLEDAINRMLVPGQENIHKFAGYFQYDSAEEDVTWFFAYQNIFRIRVKQVLGLLAYLPDNLLAYDGNDTLLEADLLCRIGNTTGIDLAGEIKAGFQLMKGISLDGGAKLQMKIRSPQDFLFEVSGGMGLKLHSVGASLNGLIHVADSKVQLSGDMQIELGSLGGLYGKLAGTYFPDSGEWDLTGSGTFKLMGYTIAEAKIRAVNGGLWVEGLLQIPNFSSLKVRGTIDFRSGAVSLSGKADLTIKGYKIASAEVTLGTAGVSFAGTLAIPNMSSVEISGSITSDGQFSVSTRADIRLLGYKIAQALIDFSNSGLTVEGSLTIPNISQLTVRGSVSSSGSIDITGTAAITVGSYRFASAYFELKNSGFRISSSVSLLGFMSLTAGGSISANGSWNIKGYWSAGNGFSFGVGSVHGSASVTASLGSDGFSFSGSIRVEYSLGVWPAEYDDSFTLTGGITISREGVGFSYRFPLIGRKTLWIKRGRGRAVDGYALVPVDYKRVFPLRAPAR